MGLTGAILGDIAGSRWEFCRQQYIGDDFELFHDDCRYTDDTVMSLATAQSMMSDCSFAKAYRRFGRQYHNAGYGGMFREWLFSEDMQPYNSYGNGSAMRVSFIGECISDIGSALDMARKSAECTHNHVEGIKGAEATVFAVYLAKTSRSLTQADICKQVCKKFGYNIEQSLEDIRKTSRFDVSCQGSLPLALRCFYESTNYESCIRNAVGTRCDRDTIACIAGGIAESYYGSTGVDDAGILRRYLPKHLFDIWNQAMKHKERFK